MWVATARSCKDCKRKLHSLSGATRHYKSCKVRRRRATESLPKPSVSVELSETSILTESANPLTEGNLHIHIPPGESDLVDRFPHAGSSVGPCPDSPQTPASERIEQPNEIETGETDWQLSTNNDGTSTKALSARSTASTSYTKTFEEETGTDAGRVYADLDPDCNPDQPSSNNPWYPFNSRLEFGLAHFFLQQCLTKGDIDAFLKSTWLDEITEKLTFTSAEHVFQLIDDIRRKDCQWKRKDVVVGSDIDGVESQKYCLRFDAVDNVVEEMIGDAVFREHTVYAPIRQYTADGQRVYTEMHTADWWWNVQQKLPPGATVVPVLIATDKTQLTQHRGDQVGWPVYMTIGNLSHAARRSQKMNGTRLVGMMPTIKDVDRSIRMQAYHDMMRIIFKRKSSLSHPLHA